MFGGQLHVSLDRRSGSGRDGLHLGRRSGPVRERLTAAASDSPVARLDADHRLAGFPRILAPLEHAVAPSPFGLSVGGQLFPVLEIAAPEFFPLVGVWLRSF